MIPKRSPSDIRTRLDFWQAASGALLALFVCCHLLLEGSVVISPSLTNGIAWFMEATYLLQIAAPVILVVIVFHFWIAARKMPFRMGELCVFVNHSKMIRERDTWLWLVQVFTAIVILVCALSHIYTVATALPISTTVSAERMNNGWLPFYVIFLPCVILHTGIGIYRLVVKFGICTNAVTETWRRRIWVVMACYCLLGALALGRVYFLG